MVIFFKHDYSHSSVFYLFFFVFVVFCLFVCLFVCLFDVYVSVCGGSLELNLRVLALSPNYY